MADERDAPDLVAAVADLQKRLADLETTTAARILRRPTGDVELALRSTPKEGTLLLQGQTVSRATYPQLWAWVLEQGLAGPALPFGVGDGTSTFVLPDLRGRCPVGATTVDPLGKAFGAASVKLTAAHLPQHSHPLSGGINGVGDHDHFIAFGGTHDGHNDRSGTCQPGVGIPYGVEPAGSHNHAMDWNGAHNHSHNFSVGNTGSASPADVFLVQPSYAVNFLIWT